MGAIFTRLLSAGASCVTAYWTYKVSSVLFVQDNLFNGGDPFVIVLLPFFLLFVICILGLILALIYVSVICAIYAANPPFAEWIFSKLRK